MKVKPNMEIKIQACETDCFIRLFYDTGNCVSYIIKPSGGCALRASGKWLLTQPRFGARMCEAHSFFELIFQKQNENVPQTIRCYITHVNNKTNGRENHEMAKSKLVKVNEKIAEEVVGGYKMMEEGAVGGYKKIEEGAVGGFNKIADKFVDQFLTKEGETVEEARIRLAEEQKAREEAKAARKGEHDRKQKEKHGGKQEV